MQIQDPRDPRNNTNNIVNQLFEKAKQLSAEQEQKPAASAATQSNRVVKIITFWKNGFTVNDGPLRSYDDPRNQSFLNDIKEGYIHCAESFANLIKAIFNIKFTQLCATRARGGSSR